MNFDKTSPKNATTNSKKFPATQRKNSPILRENCPTANTEAIRHFAQPSEVITEPESTRK